MIETFGGSSKTQGGVFSFTTQSTFNSLGPILEKKFGEWDEQSENLGKNIPHLSSCKTVHITTSSNVCISLGNLIEHLSFLEV